MGRLRQILKKKWARWGLFLTVTFLSLFVLPLYHYRPTCGGVDLSGPLRQDFIEYFEYDMKIWKFFYVKFDNEIFMRYFNPLYTLIESAHYMSYDDLISNSENKYAHLFLGPYAKESDWNKVPEAKAARDDGLAWLRDHADDDPASHPNAVIVSGDSAVGCTVFYALVIETESLPPDQRLRFFDRKSPHSPMKQ